MCLHASAWPRDDAASSRLRLRSATHARTVLHYRLPVATKDL